jgi:NAD(P)-dependent dehydrogenase (short-subunit alcohol dehydrogenase family)
MPVALVTGASKGFGRALVLDLARDGWDLIIDGRHPQPMDEVDRELRDLGAHPVCVPGDVTDPDHRRSLVAAAERLGGLDLLVANASTLGPSPLPRLDASPLDALRQVYEVNVMAPLALVQEALPLVRRSGGILAALSSDAAVEGYEGWGGYGSSKAALDQVFHVLAVEEPELRVYRFDPGDMRTEMHQAAFPGEDISDRPEPDSVVPVFRRLLESGVPSGRYRADQLVPQP